MTIVLFLVVYTSAIIGTIYRILRQKSRHIYHSKNNLLQQHEAVGSAHGKYEQASNLSS